MEKNKISEETGGSRVHCLERRRAHHSSSSQKNINPGKISPRGLTALRWQKKFMPPATTTFGAQIVPLLIATVLRFPPGQTTCASGPISAVFLEQIHHQSSPIGAFILFRRGRSVLEVPRWVGSLPFFTCKFSFPDKEDKWDIDFAVFGWFTA